ncbi:NADP-dependent oxidoreductase [Sphingomonas profundi]|uniref:NADP-dependent oxidoreductase n=1 Tax=Alterirhizorhabdus profundi TaxID=2681549 RepID=UPI0012E85A64|nr:NADP-dependent oxidoreductase [Sphingomonas profundi]
MATNRQVVLRSRPDGNPVPDNFAMAEADIPVPGEGEMLIRNLYISMEPAIRGWLDDNDANYFAPLAIGEKIRSPMVGRVVQSNNPGFAVGDIVFALLAWEDYSIASDATIVLQKLPVAADMPLSYYVGPLGGSGLTGYIGLHEVGRMKVGDTVVMSAAMGAVGHIAAQVAKLRGCRVVGILGSAEKARLAMEEYGYDAVVNYRDTDDLVGAIRAACPEGADIFYDNVGGATLDAMLVCMKDFGRIVSCGMIAGYNQSDTPPPVYNLWQMVARQLEMKGFLLPAFADKIPEALAAIEGWIREGKIKVLENRRVGLAEAPALFCDLMSGRTIGKTVLEIDLVDEAA